MIAAEGLLDFFLAMTGASLWKGAVADVLKRIKEHFLSVDTDINIDVDIDIDFHEEVCL